MQEIWKPIKGYEGLYEVSNLGQVRSLKRATTSGKILKQTRSHGGYYRVCLCKNNKKRGVAVHRLVACAFLPNRQHKAEVNHIDGNKANNAACNLEWCTRAENERHAYTVLGKKPTAYWAGKPSKQRRFTDDVIRSIRADKRPSRIIAREYGVSKTTILHIRNMRIYAEVLN